MERVERGINRGNLIFMENNQDGWWRSLEGKKKSEYFLSIFN